MLKLNIFYYFCNMKATRIIQERINAIGFGVIFGYSDLGLPADMQVAGAMALSRMVARNELKKAGRGKFYKPELSRLGEMPLMPEQLTKDLLFKNDKRIGYVTGAPAFAQMGLTTQISSKILIGSAKYRRPENRAGYIISFTKQVNEITDDTIPMLRFLDALKFIKQIPATAPDEVITVLLQQLKMMPQEQRVQVVDLAMNYSASVRAILGAMLEFLNIECEQLKSSLNVFTTYKPGISGSTLPTIKNWNIL